MKQLILWSDISNICDPASNYELMSGKMAEFADRILNCKDALKRKQSVVSALMQKHVAQLYGLTKAVVTYGKHGKPIMQDVNFNISHSVDMVVCAVSDSFVGCDIELVRKAPLEVALRYFRDEENEYLDSVPDDEKNLAFFRLWTAKESYLKMTGAGLQGGLGTFYVNFDKARSEKPAIICDGTVQSCTLNEIAIPGHNDYVCFVCNQNGIFEPEIQEFVGFF